MQFLSLGGEFISKWQCATPVTHFPRFSRQASVFPRPLNFLSIWAIGILLHRHEAAVRGCCLPWLLFPGAPLSHRRAAIGGPCVGCRAFGVSLVTRRRRLGADTVFISGRRFDGVVRYVGGDLRRRIGFRDSNPTGEAASPDGRPGGRMVLRYGMQLLRQPGDIYRGLLFPHPRGANQPRYRPVSALLRSPRYSEGQFTPVKYQNPYIPDGRAAAAWAAREDSHPGAIQGIGFGAMSPPPPLHRRPPRRDSLIPIYIYIRSG